MIKNRLLCFGILIATLSFVFFYGGKVPYVMLYTVLLLIAASLLYAVAARLFCEIECTIDRRDVVKGGDFTLSIEIKNRSPLFLPYVNLSFARIDEFVYSADDEALSVAPFSGRRTQITLTSKYRGRYDVNILDARLMDFLGILNLRLPYAKLPDILVYPRVVEIDAFPAVGKFDMDNHLNPDNVTEDMTAVSDVREYREGDGIRKIHWNLSARMFEFMSKNYENITKSRLTLLVNLAEIPGERERRRKLEDRIIEAAVSIVFHFLNQIWNVTLCYYENEYITYSLNDAAMFGMAYDHLSFVEFASDYGIAQLLESVGLNTAGERMNICVVTHEVSNELLDRLIRYSEQGYRVSLLYVCDTKWGLEKNAWVRALKKNSVALFVLDFASDLRDSLAEPA
jgi:uncharacterized protein (DUF58 family)